MEKTNTDASHEQVVPYDHEWVNIYNAESEILKKEFGDELLGIEHIGSTSVPGLPAKPIIDIMMLVANSDVADSMVSRLEKFGYPLDIELHMNTQFPERHFFRKGHPTKFHLSIAYADKGSFWKRQLAFRDYLRDHPDDRDEYASIKQKLIETYPTGKDGYIGGKTDFINEILDKSGFVRWKPPTTSE